MGSLVRLAGTVVGHGELGSCRWTQESPWVRAKWADAMDC